MRQTHVPRRRDRVRRDSDASSTASIASSVASRQPRRSANRDSRATPERPAPECPAPERPAPECSAPERPTPECSAPQRPASQRTDTFVVPHGVPPFSRLRQLEADDSIANRTRSRGVKRPAETTNSETKRWRPEQVSLLDFVSRYFSTAC